MSNLEPTTTQPDWREQYSQYLAPVGGASVLSPSFEQALNPQTHATSSTPQQEYGVRPTLGHRHSLAQLPQRQDPLQAPQIDRPDSAPGDVGNSSLEGLRQDSTIPTGSPARSNASNALTIATSPLLQVKTELGPDDGGQNENLVPKMDDDDEDDDDDMLDVEDGSGLPQTEAERRAERRKLKRFRLTHQQTRFLMSEFAKQAHPDAAHRERLSREIPGLSPRQVQVWFQNRRAKIKRLTADDRERMMKMRAVPDDFDNVQALHSPYGAVHGIGTPMVSPVDYAPSYGGDHTMMRPLLVDTMRRQDLEEHISPTGLSPAFNHIGFAPSGSMGTPDVLSPLSIASTDRYYSSHMSSPLSAGPRSSNPFLRQNSSDNYSIHGQPRQQIRPLQPLQLRETMSRSRSESLQSPLRSSMSWKGDSLDYGTYQAAGASSPTISGRQQSMYQPEQSPQNSVNAHNYDSNAYSNTSIQAPGSQSAYPTSQAPAQPTAPAVPRFRSGSSAYPPGLDLRTQYRTLPSQQSSHNPPSTPRHTSFASPFSSGGFQSAPLLAPTDFQLPRTPIDAGPRDYHMSQLSAPMAPPQDFSSAYSQGVSPPRVLSQPQQQQQQQQQSDRSFPAHPTESPAGLQQEQRTDQHAGFVHREDDYVAGVKRKRTYSMPGTYNGPS